MKTNREKKTPLYFQLKEHIKRQIEEKELKPGQCLPSENDLCQEFGISRMTVRQAINELQYEGLLYKIQGKGTFVSKDKIEQSLISLTSFSNDMRNRGLAPGSKILAFEVISATAKLSEALRINSGDKVIFLKRLRMADNEPMSIESSYLNYYLCSPLLDIPIDNISLYDVLKQELGLKLVKAAQSLETFLICGWEAGLLEVPENSLGLFIKRTTYTEDNKPLEYVESIYRGDRYKFYIEMKGV